MQSTACALLELELHSWKGKYFFSSPQRSPEAKGFFQSLKVQAFYSSPLLQLEFIPTSLCTSHSSDTPFQQTSLDGPMPKYRGTYLCTTLAVSK